MQSVHFSQCPAFLSQTAKERDKKCIVIAAAVQNVKPSVADPVSGIRDWVPFDPGIRNRFMPDPGSRIPDPKLIFLKA